MHDFEIGDFKRVFTHLIRILYSIGPEKVQELNRRWVAWGALQRLALTPGIQVPAHPDLWSRHNSEVFGGHVRHEEHVCGTL